jgi:hypothetical protein
MPITKQELEAMPEEERVFFVLNGHFLNEISMLNKWLIFIDLRAEPEVLRRAQVAQGLLIARLFIGKLLEGWRMLERAFFGTALSRQYIPKLDSTGSAALDNLGRYFGKSNILQDIRNNFSFHYDNAEVGKNFSLLPESYASELYLGPDYANSLNWACEEIVSRAMLNVTGNTDPQAALNLIMADLTRVSGWFFDFCGSVMVVATERLLGERWEEATEQIDIGEPKLLDAVGLPYFVQRSPEERTQEDS